MQSAVDWVDSPTEINFPTILNLDQAVSRVSLLWGRFLSSSLALLSLSSHGLLWVWLCPNLFLWKWNLLSRVWLFVTPVDHAVPGILQIRILEWVAFPFSRGSSQPRGRTQVSHIAGGFFTSWDRGTGHMYTYGWFMLSFYRKQHNFVKQLSFN